MTAPRILFVAVVLAFATAAVAQVAVTVSDYATTAGPAVPPISPSAPYIQAPQIAFVNASSAPVGATNATGQNVAGATNATVNNVPGISMGSWTVGVVMPGDQAASTSVATAPAEQLSLQEMLPLLDLGPSQPQPSLAQLAREARPAQRPAPTHVYTNADVKRQ